MRKNSYKDVISYQDKARDKELAAGRFRKQGN